METTNNLNSFLYDVGYCIRGEFESSNREAIYVPTDGSVTYDTMNSFFKEKISEKLGVPVEKIQLLVSARAENVINS